MLSFVLIFIYRDPWVHTYQEHVQSRQAGAEDDSPAYVSVREGGQELM